MPHQYLGVDLPLRHFPQPYGGQGKDFYRMGAHTSCRGATSPLLLVREVAMLILMDRLTDKLNWHIKVFDNEIVAKWRQEALSQSEAGLFEAILEGKDFGGRFDIPRELRVVSEKAFDYCISELRCKAEFFKQNGFWYTLDFEGNNVVKSDSIVPSELQDDLRAAFEKLRAEQAGEPDWHPWTDEKVQDLVHPSMYPFVYDRTKFIHDEVVGVDDAIDSWAGTDKGETIQKDGRAHDQIPSDYWSEKYQWLPANLAFQEDGTVKFTSYINNLNPKKHADIYKAIEKLVNLSIPAWDHVLNGCARVDALPEMDLTRRPGFELAQARFDYPPLSRDDNQEELYAPFDADSLARYEAQQGPIDVDEWVEEQEEEREDEEEFDEAEFEAAKLRHKWSQIADPLYPEPVDFQPVTYQLGQSIREKFKDSGLQVIVKMASIELTPEKPDFPAGGWHVEGQMNERIVATALYYLDSDNITTNSLAFRMQTDVDQDALQMRCGQDLYSYYEKIYGTDFADYGRSAMAIQNYGNVETPQGRFLAFPNVFQHRVSPFKLVDPTRPGHRRFVALWLVDPHQRVISTANVPPQQLDWWAEAVFGRGDDADRGDIPPELFALLLEQGVARKLNLPKTMVESLTSRLPPEVVDMVRRQEVLPEGLMTPEEARAHRLALMAERSRFAKENEKTWESQQYYSFCEH